SGVSTTKTSSEGCTGVVNDIDGPDLASNGIPQNVYTQYTFDWTLGQWFRHLYGDENNKTIFIGYNLTNLSAPSPAVVDLEAELLDEDEIRLTWSQPDKTPGWPDAEGYYLYQVENGEYNRISNLIPVGTTSYDISGLKTNTEYEYVLTTVCKVDGKDKESAWSNSATITTAKRDYKVYYKIDNEKAADISVRHLGNVNIKSGDEINENDIIKIRVSPKNRHFELVSLTLDNGGEETVFRPDRNGNIECAFALGGEANIFVSTRKTFDSAEVIFVGEYKNGEDLLGTVTAKVGETGLPAPGGTVTGDVTFTAVPQNGYTLKSWRITDAENNTDIVNAAGSNTYTLTLGSTRYTVEAEFERVSETDRPVKLTYSVASGNETGMAATKQTYQSGTAVPVGTKINFIAQAAEGYRVQKLVITKNGIPDTVITDNRLYDMYEYELTVDTQTDIKVYFTEIEKYTVTVDMPNKNAEITVKNGTSDFESGQKVNFGDEITVTVNTVLPTQRAGPITATGAIPTRPAESRWKRISVWR
ncbi:MAG: fibronectin type III domain-containing protein, partial [Clostridiales bacterium]|nr:fibronectin type III domain-containing protein [Clostridiales bacterium]